ncbi:MAG: RNHCP domain-containing protein [Patescibacteria group bacterium]|nr:RNHCP domain-containing protein [Patescibacteria group bacterium]MDD4304504.1 RNHCP domain-containing protein [Patescibacteria group bacterium]MDD4694864.1 RNHCP domain-containing protein [Patescibacteria group bacterium]
MKRFTRNREDFTCEYCGKSVAGNGYTNHCPSCLYSKHVDNNPGDRENKCGGLMEPIDVEVKSMHYVITHKCIKCHKEKRNRSSKDDSIDAILEIMQSKNSRGR